MSWLPEEEIYLYSIQNSCEKLSKLYLSNYHTLRAVQAKIKIPIIIVGSFTGITSFGTETFPQYAQKWVSVGVGVVSICIAILNSIESYLKIGESANASINTSSALQQLREDINKELALPIECRQTTGLTTLRDCYTRYQQILSQAPILDGGEILYIDSIATPKIEHMIKVNNRKYIEPGQYNRLPRKNSTESKASSFFGFFSRPLQSKDTKENRESKPESVNEQHYTKRTSASLNQSIGGDNDNVMMFLNTVATPTETNNETLNASGSKVNVHKEKNTNQFSIFTDEYESKFDKLMNNIPETKEATNQFIEITLNDERENKLGEIIGNTQDNTRDNASKGYEKDNVFNFEINGLELSKSSKSSK